MYLSNNNNQKIKMKTSDFDDSFEKDYIFIKKIITICFDKTLFLSHSECDMIFDFLYPCRNISKKINLLQLVKMEEIKIILKKNKVIIPKCYYYNYF